MFRFIYKKPGGRVNGMKAKWKKALCLHRGSYCMHRSLGRASLYSIVDVGALIPTQVPVKQGQHTAIQYAIDT